MPTVFSGSSYISRPDQGQIALIAAILTCWHWYNVGTKVLYRRPFLLSPERIIQFSRAISGSPELAAFVEDMCILEQELHPVLAPRETVTTKLQRWNTNRVVRKFLIESIKPLQLKSITFAFRGGSFKDNWNILPLDDDEFIQRTSIGSKLRKLTLIGAGSISFQQTTTVLPSDLVLPVDLEYLCLQELLLSPDYQFPTLPKLHTLHMGQCFFLANTTFYTLFVTETSLPALTTLERYAVTFVVHISPKLMRQLTMINQMDNYDLPIASSKWQKQSDFRTLRHLSHRYIAKSLAASTASFYPPTLETLTVFFPHIPSL